MFGLLSKREKIRLEIMKAFISTKPWKEYMDDPDIRAREKERLITKFFHCFINESEWIVSEQYKQKTKK